jgi:putative membrane protein
MVLGSALVLLKKVGTANRSSLICLCSGLMCGYALTLLQPGEIEASAFTFFVAGVVSVFAWVLPGISGSFMLLLLGLYALLLEGVSLLQFSVLLPIVLGAVLGLVLFSQFLTGLFQKARLELLSGLVGLMLGSLFRLWPWQRISAYQLSADGSSIPLVQEPVMPHTYEILGGANPMIMTALLIGLLGFVSVILLNRLSDIEHD